MIQLKTRILIFSSIFVLLGIISFLLWFLGYTTAATWNHNSIETQAEIIDHIIIDSNCSYSCNCKCTKRSFPPHTTCHNQCDTCYQKCYDGYILITYPINNIYHNNSILLFDDYVDYKNMMNTLNNSYSIDSNITCYYNYYNIDDVRLKLKDDVSFMIAAIVITSLVLLNFIVWGSIEIYLRFRNSEYQQLA